MTDTICHPATAWALMQKGQSLTAIATRFRDQRGTLDAAVWNWRAHQTGSSQAPGRPTEQTMGLHKLAQYDRLAASLLKVRV